MIQTTTGTTMMTAKCQLMYDEDDDSITMMTAKCMVMYDADDDRHYHDDSKV